MATPGPAAYRLPTTVGYDGHDATRTRNPCYTMRSRGDYKHSTLGPGPAYDLPCITRRGACRAPSWSLKERFSPRKVDVTPGPAGYRPECCPHKEYLRPKWSLGTRGGYQLREPVPSPNTYMIRLKSDIPHYSFRRKFGFQLNSTSPGPAHYYAKDANVQKATGPKYSLHPRMPIRSITGSPGPAAYGPDLYNTKPKPYSYSWGARHGARAPPMVVPLDFGNT
ncbi:Outer dense fiber protein 3-like protein 2 [Eumeta japonica]|uniref:Outer dense fiber protein 3-like protein 2 n=1 Tax=Eumeta variegata TaxID=151549 RepID=A0A4C1WUB1_EUMVA|nr:Outer dense fiber protein 3-like protein 2 [Eumeta japonica]